MYKILLQPLSSLKRVGPAMHKCLVRLVAQDRVFNLILHKPLRVEKISFCPRLFEVQNDELIIIKAKIESYSKPTTARHPHKIICYTPTGYLSLVFFKVFPGQMEKLFAGREIAILGNLQKSSGENQIAHPQEIIDAAPTDGLWTDGRTDEDQLGMSYPELERAMANDMLERQDVYNTLPIELGKEERAQLKKYRAIRARNMHKMLPIPVCEIKTQ